MDGVAASERDRLPVQGFTGTPEEIERQWYEQVYRRRGETMRQLTWRAVIMGAVLGGVLSLTNLYIGLKAGWASASPSPPASCRTRSGPRSTAWGSRHAPDDPRRAALGCARRRRSPAGVGLAWTFHWYYGVLFFVGGLLGWWLEKKHPQLSQELTFPVASGWIAGESLMGVALVLWENGPELVRRLVGR